MKSKLEWKASDKNGICELLFLSWHLYYFCNFGKFGTNRFDWDSDCAAWNQYIISTVQLRLSYKQMWSFQNIDGVQQ